MNRQNAVGSVPKAKILEIPRNLYIFEIGAVAVQNMVAFASAGPREGLLYIGVEITPSPREEGNGMRPVQHPKPPQPRGLVGFSLFLVREPPGAPRKAKKSKKNDIFFGQKNWSCQKFLVTLIRSYQ